MIAWVAPFWAALSGMVAAVVAWTAGVVAWAVGGVVVVVLGVLTVLVGWLPEAPTPDHASVGNLELLATVNMYVPVVESVALLGVWAVLFSGIGLYKAAKFVRGGG